MLFRRLTNFKTTVPAVLTLTVFSVVGCSDSGFESHFVDSESTTSLIKEAKAGYKGHAGVTALVDERFGNPQELKAWKKMPLDVGGVFGTIAESPDPSIPVKSLKLEVNGDFESFDKGEALLQVVSGEAATEVVVLDRWNAETGVCEFTSPMSVSPSAGDQIVIGGGSTLKSGRGLYMRHCSHCHGTSGDGNGPTAEYLYPRPRDYRNGVFKFTSTKSLFRPATDDIHRILTNGIPGTYMPSFVPMLDDQELHEVVEYVRFLAMRGEFERKIAAGFASSFSQSEYRSRLEDGEERSEILEELEEYYTDELPDYLVEDADAVAGAWQKAADPANIVVPSVSKVDDTIESRRRGRELFVGAKLNCINCHGIGGEGNGPQTREYEIVDKKPRKLPGLHDDWGHVVKPRNLRSGIYRGGRRPIDIFRRLYSGINGAKMPAFGGKVSDEELWDVVNYVLSIPFETEPGHAPVSVEEAASVSSL